MTDGEMAEVSDGNHTFKELYEHRGALYLALMKAHPAISWMSSKHDTGWEWKGFFLAGMRLPTGDITYHLPNDLWESARATGARVLEKAPFWDRHTSDDVVKRLLRWVVADD